LCLKRREMQSPCTQVQIPDLAWRPYMITALQLARLLVTNCSSPAAALEVQIQRPVSGGTQSAHVRLVWMYLTNYMLTRSGFCAISNNHCCATCAQQRQHQADCSSAATARSQPYVLAETALTPTQHSQPVCQTGLRLGHAWSPSRTVHHSSTLAASTCQAAATVQCAGWLSAAFSVP
jgi:hypothetical protein